MGIADLLVEALWQSGALALRLMLIVVPLVALFELLRELPFFRLLGPRFDPLMRSLGLGRDAALPLFTGVFLGIAYGAGILIRVSQEKKLSRRELFLLGLFLAICHAVVEDTLLFVVLGGDGLTMLGIRLLLALLLTALLARLWRTKGDGETSLT